MKKVLYILLILFLSSCNFSPGIHGLDILEVERLDLNRTEFEIQYKLFENGYPSYQAPSKWSDSINYWNQVFGFVDCKYIYFNQNPEELYFVTLIGDSKDTTSLNQTLFYQQTLLGVRASFDSINGWRTENDFTENETNRITRRFKTKIIPKIKKASSN